jgi:hypothetical protein
MREENPMRKGRTWTWIWVLGACVTSVMLAVPAAAADDDWHFSVTPLSLWAFGIEGPYSIQGHARDVDASYDDVKDKLNGGAGVSFEFGKGKWSGFFNASKLEFEEEDAKASTPMGNAEADVLLRIETIEGGVAYRLPVEPGSKAPRIELLGGVRFNEYEGEIQPSQASVVDESVDWTDPFFGLRLAQPIKGSLAFVTRGDVGGFGGGGDSRSQATWNWTGGFGYHWKFGGWGMNLFGGYRLTEIDLRGEDSEDFQVIQRYQGPVMSLSFDW